jgi:putative ABC transport system substrate-binding protein
MLPKASKFAALVNPTNPIFMRDTVQGAQNAAQRLGLQIVFLDASNQDEIERAFASAVEQGAAALLANESFFESQRERIAELGLRHKLPTTTGGAPQAVMAGVLMSYGADNADFYRQAGIYVGRILQGERPSDLPVMQPTKFDFVINLKTAKAIGLTVPPALLARADEVIE